MPGESVRIHHHGVGDSALPKSDQNRGEALNRGIRGGIREVQGDFEEADSLPFLRARRDVEGEARVGQRDMRQAENSTI